MAMSPEERRAKQREWSRAWREKNPEAYRAGAREAMRKKRAENPGMNAEACRRYQERHRPEILEGRREKWAADPDLRTHSNAKRLEHHYEHRDAANERRTKNGQIARAASPWAKFFHGAQQRAKKKSVPFEITREWMEAKWTGRCEITGIEFRLGKTTRGPGLFSPSLDRIIPALGYIPDNCRFVLWGVNALKAEGTDAEMLEIAEAIVFAMRVKP